MAISVCAACSQSRGARGAHSRRSGSDGLPSVHGKSPDGRQGVRLDRCIARAHRSRAPLGSSANLNGARSATRESRRQSSALIQVRCSSQLGDSGWQSPRVRVGTGEVSSGSPIEDRACESSLTDLESGTRSLASDPTCSGPADEACLSRSGKGLRGRGCRKPLQPCRTRRTCSLRVHRHVERRVEELLDPVAVDRDCLMWMSSLAISPPRMWAPITVRSSRRNTSLTSPSVAPEMFRVCWR